jgi:UTP:GlnB (protein PII) uridylyltransferase
MANRQLTAKELEEARALLAEIRAKLIRLSRGDKDLLFAYRRKIYKELIYDERSKPMERRRLKQMKRKEQNGLCAVCRKPLPETYVVLDRFKAADGYTVENTRLIHQACDVKVQGSRNYA